jgi:hypothetical protein
MTAANRFLSLTPGKLALFLSLFLIGGVFGFLTYGKYSAATPGQYGFPFAMNSATCTGSAEDGPCADYIIRLDWIRVILDAAVWYIAACVLAFAYNRMVKK